MQTLKTKPPLTRGFARPRWNSNPHTAPPRLPNPAPPRGPCPQGRGHHLDHSRGPVARDQSEDKGERSMARWLSARRREASDGSLHPTYRDGLARVPGGKETPGQPRMMPGGMTASPSWRTSVPRATTGPATATMPRNESTPSGCGSTPSGTNTAAATSTPPGSSSWISPCPVGRPEGPGAAHPGHKRRSGRLTPECRLSLASCAGLLRNPEGVCPRFC
jgi:hypothetical protein